MNTPKNITAAAVLNTLSPASLSALEGHFRAQFVSSLEALTKKIAGSAPIAATADDANDSVEQPAAPAKKRGRPAGSKNKVTVEAPAKTKPAKTEEPKKRGPKAKAKAAKATGAGAPAGKRQLDSKGRTASEVIREFDAKHPEAKANDAVAYCHKLGLTKVVPANVFNVRAIVAKKAEAEAKAAAKAKKAKAAAK